jgi:hypothetical protein
LPGARFERVADLGKVFAGAGDTPLFVSVAEAARRCNLKPKTLYNWIEKGCLGQEHGVRNICGTYRIDWPLFKAWIDRGELASCT